MRYARTKDNIYEVVEDRHDGLWLVVKEEKPNNYNFKISLQRVIKQSDNPRELCDVCIVKRKEGDFLYGAFYQMEGLIESFKDKVKSNNPIVAIYGAIKIVDSCGVPHIKTVIKMNEKGEWELL